MKMNVENKLDKVVKILKEKGFVVYRKGGKEAMMPIDLELYYEVGVGLMAVEPGAVESGTIYSPYTRELYDNEKV